MNEPDNKANAAKTSEFQISFTRSLSHRAVNANGAWFTSDSEGNINLMFYRDYLPPPSKVVMLVNEQGNVVGEAEQKREIHPGTIREVESTIVISQKVASDLCELLRQNLEAINKSKAK